MNALTREMRFIIHELNHFYYHIEPATTPQNVSDALRRLRPSIIAFSAHSANGKIVMENDIGNVHIVSSDDFASIIENAYKNSDTLPSCIVLLACNTTEIAMKLSEKFPKACVMFWKSKYVEDEGARVFTEGFFRSLHEYIENKMTLAQYIKCWNNAVKVFTDQFEIGDPALWLDKVPKEYPPRKIRGIPAYVVNSEMHLHSSTISRTPTKVQKIIQKNSPGSHSGVTPYMAAMNVVEGKKKLSPRRL